MDERQQENLAAIADRGMDSGGDGKGRGVERELQGKWIFLIEVRKR